MSIPKSKSNRVVDLVLGDDGEYTAKRVHIAKPSKNSKFKGFLSKEVKNSIDARSRYNVSRETDDFLNGVDAGLDLLDKFIPRVDRFVKLMDR